MNDSLLQNVAGSRWHVSCTTLRVMARRAKSSSDLAVKARQRFRNLLVHGLTGSLLLTVLTTFPILLASCGSTSAGPTPPPDVTVTVQPAGANLFLGQSQQFGATVSGTSNTGVIWKVNGIPGGGTATGTITPAGLYLAPGVLPSPASVTISAVSAIDSQASGNATVTIADDVSVTLSPLSVSVPSAGTQIFTATVTGSGSPSLSVAWSVNGIAGGNSSVGTIFSTGTDTALYTAPAVPPLSGTVTVAATSVADPTKSGDASVTITCAVSNLLSPATANVALGATQSLAATLCPPVGALIVWDVNGIVGGNATIGTIASTGSASAAYTAPIDLPVSNPVTIHATAGASSASATVTLTDAITVSISPGTISLAIGLESTFAANVSNTSDATVNWFVNGVPNGNSTVGQICLPGSNPCAPPAAPVSGSVGYLAPAAVPAANPVTLTATSHADSSKSGTAFVIITGPAPQLSVSISPSYAFLPPSTGVLSTQQFVAAVTGTSNTGVTWSVQSGVPGQGCAGAACGSVDANGLYTAPTVAPSPNAIAITAASEADTTKSASASISLTSGPLINAMLPSSTIAGDVESFTLEVQGMNFVAGTGSTASAILINGTSRSTTCQTATLCTTPINPLDVQSPATLTIQVQNPGAPTQLSNPVPFVIVPFDASQDGISLTSSAPTIAGKNIVVVEPTTEATSAAIDVDFVGMLTGGNVCGIQGSPLTVTRPASGTATVSICVHGNGLAPTFLYAFTGPPGGDIGVTASAISGLFPNTIELDLTLSSTTLPGTRTLFITTLNGDRAAATGMLEVQ